MFYKKALALLILTVTMVTKSAVAQDPSTACPEMSFEGDFSAVFTDCPIVNTRNYVMCCLQGDPHIRTFDGYRYKYGAKGYFIALGPCVGRSINGEVDVYMKPRQVNDTQFRIVGVRITKDGTTYEFTFKRKEGKRFTVNGALQNLTHGPIPYNDGHAVAFINPLRKREFIFICPGLRMSINCKFHRIYIWIPITDLNQGVCGLCGSYNNNRADDANCRTNCPGDCALNSEDCDIKNDFGPLWMTDGSGEGSGEGSGDPPST